MVFVILFYMRQQIQPISHGSTSTAAWAPGLLGGCSGLVASLLFAATANKLALAVCSGGSGSCRSAASAATDWCCGLLPLQPCSLLPLAAPAWCPSSKLGLALVQPDWKPVISAGSGQGCPENPKLLPALPAFGGSTAGVPCAGSGELLPSSSGNSSPPITSSSMRLRLSPGKLPQLHQAGSESIGSRSGEGSEELCLAYLSRPDDDRGVALPLREAALETGRLAGSALLPALDPLAACHPRGCCCAGPPWPTTASC